MSTPNDSSRDTTTTPGPPEGRPAIPRLFGRLPRYIGRTALRTSTVLLAVAFILCGWAYLSLSQGLSREQAAPVAPVVAPTSTTEPVLPQWLEKMRPSLSTTDEQDSVSEHPSGSRDDGATGSTGASERSTPTVTPSGSRVSPTAGGTSVPESARRAAPSEEPGPATHTPSGFGTEGGAPPTAAAPS